MSGNQTTKTLVLHHDRLLQGHQGLRSGHSIKRVLTGLRVRCEEPHQRGLHRRVPEAHEAFTGRRHKTERSREEGFCQNVC